jgi:hypothetical protein
MSVRKLVTAAGSGDTPRTPKTPTADDDDDFQYAPGTTVVHHKRKKIRQSLGYDFDAESGAAAEDAEHVPLAVAALASSEDQPEGEEPELGPKRVETTWVVWGTWETINHTTAEINDECSKICKAKLRAAGMDKLPATHKHLPTDLGFWKYKDQTFTAKGRCVTKYYRCPLAHRTECPHKVRAKNYGGSVILEGTEGHAEFLHIDKNSKILSWRQTNAIAAAVRTAPHQSAASIRRNLVNLESPTKIVEPKMLAKVRRVVRKERDHLTTCNLNGVHVDGSYGSLTEFCRAIKFSTLIEQHNDPAVDFHLDFFQTVCIGSDIDAQTNTIFIALTNVWMLCEIARVRNSKWALQIQGDGTFKVCVEAVCLLGLGVNRVGAHFHPVALLIVPDGAETEDAWTQLWKCVRYAMHRLFNKFRPCPLADCKLCVCISDLKDSDEWGPIIRGENFQRHRILDIDYATGDNNWAWANFCANELGLSANVCSSHTTGTIYIYVEYMWNSDGFDLQPLPAPLPSSAVSSRTLPTTTISTTT